MTVRRTITEDGEPQEGQVAFSLYGVPANVRVTFSNQHGTALQATSRQVHHHLHTNRAAALREGLNAAAEGHEAEFNILLFTVDPTFTKESLNVWMKVKKLFLVETDLLQVRLLQSQSQPVVVHDRGGGNIEGSGASHGFRG